MANMTPGATEGETEKVTTVIAEDLEIKGTVRFQSSLLTKGIIEGEIISQGLLIVAPTARVTATITTKSLISHGKIQGDVTATDKAILKKTAVHDGNITTPNIIIEGGSVFNGSCIMQNRPRNLSATTPIETAQEPAEVAAPAWSPAPVVEERREEPADTEPLHETKDEAEAEKVVESGSDSDQAAVVESEDSVEDEGSEAAGPAKTEDLAAEEEKGDEAEKTEGIWTFNDGDYPRKPKLF